MAERTRAAGRPARRRRTPEQAQQEILDAAERLIAASGPDAVGLQQVAREAGVSHALVTHYFRTYEALVGAVLERRTRAAREEALALLAKPGWDPTQAPLIDVLFRLLADPLHVRLLAWAALSGRSGLPELLAGAGGLRQIVDGVVAYLRRAGAKRSEAELRQEMEFGLTTALCASFGYGICGADLQRALGHEPSSEAAQDFHARLRVLLLGN